jgi:hypothetical protein
MPAASPSSDASYIRLHAACWSIGAAAYVEWGEPEWLVSGSNGENLSRPEGPTRDASWWASGGQARAVGMIGRAPED